jgi:hypothetical protein
MDPYPFTDSTGRAWHVYDFRIVNGRKRAVPINDPRAEKRAFVPATGGTVLIHEFGLVSYHSTANKLIEDQLRFAKPLDATAGERLNGGSQ